MFDDYKHYIADKHNFFQTFYTLKKVFHDSESNPKSILNLLGLSLNSNLTRLKTVGNGFLSMFTYINTPLGIIELQIQTKMRLKIQSFGTAAHSQENKAPFDITLPNDPNGLTSKDVEKISSLLDYAVPLKSEYAPNLDNPTGVSINVTRFDRLTGYSKELKQINYSDPTNAIERATAELWDQTAQLYKREQILPDLNENRIITENTIEDFIYSSLSNVFETSKDAPDEIQTQLKFIADLKKLREQRASQSTTQGKQSTTMQGNQEQETSKSSLQESQKQDTISPSTLMTCQITQEEIDAFFAKHPELDPVPQTSPTNNSPSETETPDRE